MWEGRDARMMRTRRLEFLDDQLKIGNVTTDEHATKTAALADFKARLSRAASRMIQHTGIY